MTLLDDATRLDWSSPEARQGWLLSLAPPIRLAAACDLLAAVSIGDAEVGRAVAEARRASFAGAALDDADCDAALDALGAAAGEPRSRRTPLRQNDQGVPILTFDNPPGVRRLDLAVGHRLQRLELGVAFSRPRLQSVAPLLDALEARPDLRAMLEGGDRQRCAVAWDQLLERHCIPPEGPPAGRELDAVRDDLHVRLVAAAAREAGAPLGLAPGEPPLRQTEGAVASLEAAMGGLPEDLRWFMEQLGDRGIGPRGQLRADPECECDPAGEWMLIGRGAVLFVDGTSSRIWDEAPDGHMAPLGCGFAAYYVEWLHRLERHLERRARFAELRVGMTLDDLEQLRGEPLPETVGALLAAAGRRPLELSREGIVVWLEAGRVANILLRRIVPLREPRRSPHSATS